jgi:hypothetical protein
MRSMNSWLNRNALNVSKLNYASSTNGWHFRRNSACDEIRHPKTMEMWPEVRSMVADLIDQLRAWLIGGTQASSSPQMVASSAGNVLAACLACRSVACADVAVCGGLPRQGTLSTPQGNTPNA